ncbi:UPF0175 family protein [Nitratifractor sp.]
MTKALEEGHSVFVTKHGKPIGITIPLTEEVLSMGVIKAVALEQYKNGMISLGKMAELMGISKREAIKLLDDLGIDWMGYDKEELKEQEARLEKLV